MKLKCGQEFRLSAYSEVRDLVGSLAQSEGDNHAAARGAAGYRIDRRCLASVEDSHGDVGTASYRGSLDPA